MASRAKNRELPGVENGKIIKEVSDKAEEFEDLRDKWQKLGEKMNNANDELVQLMASHRLKGYRDDNYSPPLIVEIKAKDPTKRAKVSREKSKADE